MHSLPALFLLWCTLFISLNRCLQPAAFLKAPAPNRSRPCPTAPPHAPSFYRFFPLPLPSAAPPSAFPKNCFFHWFTHGFSRRRSTFCTNRAHKLCVSSQGFFSFCIPSRFSGISKLYKLFACFIIYFSFFAMFNCLLYSHNFLSVSWRIMNKALI